MDLAAWISIAAARIREMPGVFEDVRQSMSCRCRSFHPREEITGSRVHTTLSTITIYVIMDDNGASYTCEAIHGALTHALKAKITIDVLYQAFLTYPHRPTTLHSPTENSLAVLNHKILEANSQVQNVKLGGHVSFNKLIVARAVGHVAPSCCNHSSWTS
ncbi:synaptogenesis protein syg-2 [Trichonephila clavipes]|nr:synaptogenesis protein syg-2 [Trichonephila clavipes]